MHPSELDRPSAWPSRRAPGGAAPRLAVAAAAFGGGAWATAALLFGTPGAGAIAATAFAVLAATAVTLFARHWAHDRIGPANLVTLGRGALACVLVVPLVDPTVAAAPTTAWALFGLGGVTLALDGIDGRLARRTGLATAFGARFDVEVDAVFAALLALVALRTGEAGPAILLLGFMRYAFVAAALAWPWLLAPLPERPRRKVVCVVQIGTLVALLSPAVEPPLSGALALAATALLAWSFALDVHRLARG